MSYIETLESAAEVARTASQTASEASQIIHDVAHGGEETTVTTQSGPVKSVSKAIKDISETILGGVTTPVRRTATATADQSIFVFDDISMASTTIYVNGLLRIDYSIDDAHQVTFDTALSEGDQVVAIERHLDYNIDNVLTVAEDYAAQAEQSATDAEGTLISIGDLQSQVQNSVEQAELYATQAATGADDARRVSEAAQTDIRSLEQEVLTAIEESRDSSVATINEEVVRAIDNQELFSGAYEDLTGKPTLGTAASNNVEDFASNEQGQLAETAVQGVGITAIRQMTRDEYDAIETKDPQVLYIIGQ